MHYIIFIKTVDYTDIHQGQHNTRPPRGVRSVLNFFNLVVFKECISWVCGFRGYKYLYKRNSVVVIVY